MKRSIAFIACVLAGTAQGQEVVRYDGQMVVRVTVRGPADMLSLQAIAGEGILNCNPRPGVNSVVVDQEQMDALREAGLAPVVTVADLQAAIEAERAHIEQTNRQRDASWFQDYKTYDQFMARLNEVAATYPGLAQTVDLGDSLEGREIRGIRITGPGDPSARPAVFYHGGQHAREWVSPMTTMYVADQILERYASDANIRALVDSVEWFIVPIANPDGYVYTWTNQRLWRKNRRNNGGSFGVDLNRNWGYQWGGEGSSGNGDSETYRGTGPFSEPETQRLRDFVVARPRIAAHIDFHSFSQLILTPWGYTVNLPPDNAEFMRVGERMHDAIQGVHGEDYVYGPTYTTIYPASGISSDWTYGDRGILGMGIELRDTGDFGFELPADQILPCAEENFAGVLELTAYVAYPISFGYPDGIPEYLDAGAATDVRVEIVNGSGSYQNGSGRIHYSIGGGAFTQASLVSEGGGVYRGTLPAAACGLDVRFYFSAQSTGGQTVYGPVGGEAAAFSASATEATPIFDDDFETNKNWTVSNTSLTDGAWERGIPAGGGDRLDPPTDYDGSSRCYLTANRAGNSDVDGGPTRLTSPTFDLSGVTAGKSAVVSYAYWFGNDDLDIDRLTVEVSSNNGGSWVTVASHGHSGAWVPVSFDPADYVSLSSQMKLRFSATDNPNDSVTEAGLDAVHVAIVGCEEGCAADCDGDGVCDDDEIAGGAPDCNGNGVPDECDVDPDFGGASADCQQDGVPDECQVAGNDCDSNGVPDDCQLAGNDCNANGIPDTCEALTDCNNDGTPDECQLAGNDCNGNGELDECEALNDCDQNGVADECDPNFCPPDLAPPFGTLNVFDFLAFQNYFSDSNACADLAPPFGQFNVFDFLEFQNEFSEGC